MAKGDKQDVARAKAAYTKATVKSYAKYPKAVLQQKAWDKASEKVKSAPTQKAKEAARAKAIKARDKSSETTRKFNKVNNERLEMQAKQKQNAVNKMKAQGGKIGLSPTSSALERARAKKGNK